MFIVEIVCNIVDTSRFSDESCVCLLLYFDCCLVLLVVICFWLVGLCYLT